VGDPRRKISGSAREISDIGYPGQGKDTRDRERISGIGEGKISHWDPVLLSDTREQHFAFAISNIWE
jgi:hypothetical protein